MPRPVLIALIVSVVVIAIAVGRVLLGDGAASKVQYASDEVMSHTLWGPLGWVQDKLGRMSQSFKDLRELEKEVFDLRSKNARLTTENRQLKFFRKKNAELEEMLGFKKASPYKLLSCRVIQRDPSNWWSVLIINRGYADHPDLTSDQPVVTPRGVVGKTGTISRHTSRVILLVDENCKISCEVEGSRAQGIIRGESKLNQGLPYCTMSFVSRDTPMAKGSRVFTSGLGGIFPQGLLLGTVRDAPPASPERNFGLYLDAQIEPSVDLHDLRDMFIVIGVRE